MYSLYEICRRFSLFENQFSDENIYNNYTNLKMVVYTETLANFIKRRNPLNILFFIFPIHTHTHTHIYTHALTKRQTYTQLHIHTHTHTHTYIYIYIYSERKKEIFEDATDRNWNQWTEVKFLIQLFAFYIKGMNPSLHLIYS